MGRRSEHGGRLGTEPRRTSGRTSRSRCVYGVGVCMVSVRVCEGVWCIRSDGVVGGEAVWLSGWMNEGGCVCG